MLCNQLYRAGSCPLLDTYLLPTLALVVPTGTPLNLTFPRTTTTTLTLSWDPPRFDLQNGIIRYYVVYVSDLTSGTSWDFTTNMTRVVVDNLQPFYQYNCSVAAFTIDLGPVSDTVTVRLPQTRKNNCVLCLLSCCCT